jgi:hypothetical protein
MKGIDNCYADVLSRIVDNKKVAIKEKRLIESIQIRATIATTKKLGELLDEDFMEIYHKDLDNLHPETNAMASMLRANGYKITNETKRLINEKMRNGDTCQYCKLTRTKESGTLQPIPPDNNFWRFLLSNICGPILGDRRKMYFVMLVDR